MTVLQNPGWDPGVEKGHPAKVKEMWGTQPWLAQDDVSTLAHNV